MFHYELYFYPLGQIAFSILFLILTFVSLYFVYGFWKANQKWKEMLLTGVIACFCFGVTVDMASIASENAAYTWKVLRAEEVTFQDDTFMSGKVQRLRLRGADERLEFQSLKISGTNRTDSVIKFVDTFHSQDFMAIDFPDFTFKEFTMKGRTYYSRNRPFLFTSEGERIWFQ